MAKLILHTRNGAKEIDSDKVSNDELTELNISRDKLQTMIPLDIPSAIKELQDKVKMLELIVG